jgi:hypothetical protein
MKYRSTFSLAILVGCLLPAPFIFSQHQELNEKPGIWKGKQTIAKDSSSLLYAFKNGKIEGHFRYFLSITDNHRALSDYYANAVGGGLRYETDKFRGFQFAVSGFYIFNIGSSDLTQRDPTTQQFNRYEIGLFDVEDPSNKKDLDRLEELYLKYNFRKSFIKYGRQLINTPFINLQDGRMRPTGVEGIWLELNEVKRLQLEGGWIYAISPRSTVKWYSAATSVGIYPVGVNIDGKRSNYANHIESKGVFMLGAKFLAAKWLDITAWNLFFENVFNTAMIQADVNIRQGEHVSYIGGWQLIRQDAVNNGGNADPNKTYINKGSSAMTAGARAGVRYNQLEITVNYNRIFKNGRYLMPREWGRDPFFTFMPRERNEGLADVHAVVGKLNYRLPAQRLSTSLSVGYFKLPDVKNFAFNKYGMPSYTQINAEIRYHFNGILKGLDAQLLLVTKLNEGETYGDKRFEFNKVNMVLYNLVLNYHF